MPVPWQVMNKIRSKIRSITDDSAIVDETFFGYDYDTKQIISNRKIGTKHWIFDLDGNLIKYHD